MSNESYIQTKYFQIFQVVKEVFRSNTQYIQNNLFAAFSRFSIGYDISKPAITFVWMCRFTQVGFIYEMNVFTVPH